MSTHKKHIILIGGGGHCKSCIDVIEATGKYEIAGILDLPSELGKKVLGYEIIGNDDDYQKYLDLNYSFLITAGQIKSAELRKRIFEKLDSIGAEIETVIAPNANVSKHAVLGRGTVIMQNATVNASAHIGENCIINTGAIIEHDAVVGNHTHISTAAVVNGGSKVGDRCFVGSNSCISSGVEIESDIIIGAGSTVVKNISEAGVYVGTPAKKTN